ncbi:hypothetical protein C4K20_4079 [Pseudomonas chlororaphis subsp. aurantiaca]|nr:hypothetical protein C4K20_4079 [Pseudomonas chlororaphis subsp. aurantiaca]
MSPFAGNRTPTVFSRSQEGPAGLFAACGSGYRDLRQAKKSRASSLLQERPVDARLPAIRPSSQDCTPMYPVVFSRSQEGPAGLFAACGSGYRDLRRAKKSRASLASVGARLARDGRNAVYQKPTLA